MNERRISQPNRLSRAIRAITEPQVRRILLVDDEELIRSALSKFLRSKGYEVTTCDSGPAALDALEREKHVLMLADVRMPGMTAFLSPHRGFFAAVLSIRPQPIDSQTII